ncbi:MAG: hypothetical protein JWL70_1210 [Acidimicrobiia bacterium]|nr:hypothetical protein [Acidimicrobiia bacterium]
MKLARFALVIGTTAVAGLLPVVAPGTATAATAAYGPTISVAGHGFGHGRGLGQFGAYGYAVDQGWSSNAILDHYYPNAPAGTADPNSSLGVRIMALDGSDTIVMQDRGRLLTSAAPGTPFTAVRITKTPTGGLAAFAGTGCDGGPAGWQPLPAVSGTTVSFDVLNPNPDSADLGDLMALCQPGNTKRWYRGTVSAILDSSGTQHTVNVTTIERYVRGVVPRESPASWGDSGGGKGINALKAQAVAARSYALSESRYSYAKTCDTQSCQVYGGVAAATPPTATPVRLEDARSDRAVAETAGAVRMLNGSIARTEFSSSTGGYTAGGTFPAVIDEGDATSINTSHHNWTASINTADVVTHYPQLGSLTLIEVTSRNGLGDFGGRVRTVVLHGTDGSVTLSGDDFRLAFDLQSDWFNITSIPTAVPTTPIPTAHAPTQRSLGMSVIGAASAGGSAYWVTSGDGSVQAVNGAPNRGSMAGVRLNQPMIGITSANATGYWLLARDGGIFSFGVPFFGSKGADKLKFPVVAMAGRPQGDGYWLVQSDGGVWSFAGAKFHGSMSSVRLNQPVVSMAATASGNGYWLIASDGGMFSFGDAHFWGSTGDRRVTSPVVAMAARPQGDGYWIVTADGQLFAFGSAPNLGAPTQFHPTSPMVAMASSPTGNGYLAITANGTVYAFGDAA